MDFSFVIPVYKTESFLDRCLESIVDSFYGTDLTYEIILVDDGNYPPLQHQRFNCEIIRHDFNRSCFQARISGFMRAKGQWILAVDPDDVLVNMEWRKIKEQLQSSNADILMFPQRRCFLPELNVLLHKTLEEKTECFSGNGVLNFYRERSVAWSVTAKIFSKNLVDKVAHYFNENKKEAYLNFSEDYAMTTCLIFCANKLILNDVGLYLYCSRSGSLTNDGWLSDKFKTNRNLDYYQTSKYLVQDFIEGLSVEPAKKRILKDAAYESFNKIPGMLMPELVQTLIKFPDLWPKFVKVFSERVLIDTLGLRAGEEKRSQLLRESDLAKLQATHLARRSTLMKLRPILVKCFPADSLVGRILRELYLYGKDGF